MGALCAVVAVIAVVIPFAQGLALLGTVPTGLLAYRHRCACDRGTVAAGFIAFLIGGRADSGWSRLRLYRRADRIVKRKGRGTPTVVVSSVFAGRWGSAQGMSAR